MFRRGETAWNRQDAWRLPGPWTSGAGDRTPAHRPPRRHLQGLPARSVAAAALLAAGLLTGPACGRSGTASSPSASGEVLSLKLETAHFRVWADRALPSTLRDVADTLEAALPRISVDLGVTAMPTTTVEVWTDRESFYADMAATLGRRYEGATGYVAGATNITILAGANPASAASHELAHCASLRANPSLGNNPRWLWETVALYENGDFVDPRTLTYLVAGNYPTLAQLDGDYSSTRQIYEVGFLIGEFVVAAWGKDGLVRLIAVNGDVMRAFGAAVSEFEQRWADFVRQKYFGRQPGADAIAGPGANAHAEHAQVPGCFSGIDARPARSIRDGCWRSKDATTGLQAGPLKASRRAFDEAPREPVDLDGGLRCVVIGLEDLVIGRVKACKHCRSEGDCEAAALLVAELRDLRERSGPRATHAADDRSPQRPRCCCCGTAWASGGGAGPSGEIPTSGRRGRAWRRVRLTAVTS